MTSIERAEQHDEERAEHRDHEHRRHVLRSIDCSAYCPTPCRLKTDLGQDRATADDRREVEPDSEMTGIRLLRSTWRIITWRSESPLRARSERSRH